jgi:hypothetical protein
VFQECSSTLPLLFLIKQKGQCLVFSVTMKGLVHLGCNFPEASVCGLHNNTKSLASMFFSLTFLLLHALFCFDKTVGFRLLSCVLIQTNLWI